MANSRRFTVEILGDAKGARKAVKDTDDALGRLSVTGRASAGGLRILGTGLKGLGVAAAATAVVGVGALAGFGKSVVDTGVQYQNSLNSMQAVSHATNAQMAQVGKTARDLGNDLSLPATSAADATLAMTELAKGNLSASQAMMAAKGTLQLAAAAQVDGATAAGIQANALNAFSLSADKAGHVADVLANASNAATGEIADFAHGLQASSAVAAQFHISLDDTVTALAEFANKGIQGSDAGTSLKSALLALASPSAQARKALRQLHLDAFDARGQFVGLASVSEQLAKAQKHMSQEAFAAAVSTAFGSDAARAAGIFATEGAEGFAKMAAAVGRSGGAAEVAKAKMKGVGGAIEGLKSQIETVKIDVFTREAPHLESFVRLLSDKLPAAADAGLKGLDAVTSWAQRELPRARQAVLTFGPAVQTWVAGKLEIAGHAAQDVAGPALRGVGNVLREVASQAQGAGHAFDGGLNAAISGAARVAREFEAESVNVGRTLGDLASSAGQVAHDVLPALKVGFAAAGASAGALVTGVAGAAAILSPFAGAALAATAAVKGTQLAVAGFGAAQTGVAKVTAAWARMSEQVAFAAGRVTEFATKRLGADLNTAGAAGAQVMTKTQSAFTRFGQALPVVGVGLIAIGYAHEKAAQQAQENLATNRALFDALRQGGHAADEARRTLDAFTGAAAAMQKQGGLSATTGNMLAGSIAEARKQSQQAFDSMSALDQASAKVAETQATLSDRVHTYGVGSVQANAAADAYNGALSRQRELQQQVADATKTSEQRLAELTARVNDAAGASLALQQAELNVKADLSAAATAQDTYNRAVSQYGTNSKQAKDAALNLAQSQVTLKQQILGSATAARHAAEALDKSGDAAVAGAAGDRAYRAELIKFAATLAPGSDASNAVRQWIRDLDTAAKPRKQVFTFVSDTSAWRPPNGGPAIAGLRAGGGPVSAGKSYVVGEKRAELFVPDQDGTIVPRVPSSASSGTAVGGGSARVVLEVRSGGSRLDDLLVEILRNAVRVRGGGNVQVALGQRS